MKPKELERILRLVASSEKSKDADAICNTVQVQVLDNKITFMTVDSSRNYRLYTTQYNEGAFNFTALFSAKKLKEIIKTKPLAIELCADGLVNVKLFANNLSQGGKAYCANALPAESKIFEVIFHKRNAFAIERAAFDNIVNGVLPCIADNFTRSSMDHLCIDYGQTLHTVKFVGADRCTLSVLEAKVSNNTTTFGRLITTEYPPTVPVTIFSKALKSDKPVKFFDAKEDGLVFVGITTESESAALTCVSPIGNAQYVNYKRVIPEVFPMVCEFNTLRLSTLLQDLYITYKCQGFEKEFPKVRLTLADDGQSFNAILYAKEDRNDFAHSKEIEQANLPILPGHTIEKGFSIVFNMDYLMRNLDLRLKTTRVEFTEQFRPVKVQGHDCMFIFMPMQA